MQGPLLSRQLVDPARVRSGASRRASARPEDGPEEPDADALDRLDRERERARERGRRRPELPEERQARSRRWTSSLKGSSFEGRGGRSYRGGPSERNARRIVWR